MDTIPPGKQYDVILANINLNVITASLTPIATITHPGTEVVFSGFLSSDEETMITAIQKAGFQHVLTTQKGDWISIRAKKS
jgi:ribosomal protein L11 methyltransferase